jgi:CheY-like chemotaxis protein/HPt (histidine-containing phosphotransfer) domain-containing protein
VAVAAGLEAPGPDPHRPPAATPADRPTAPSIAEARARGRLILVAEDDTVNQKVVLKQLALLGYAAEVASDGAEALRLWESGRHALLLSDLHMPELDGYALSGAIREAEGRGPAAVRMPILALTANALRDEASRVRAAGMDECLTKPIQLAALAKALGRWLPHAEPGQNSATRPAELDRTLAQLPLDVSVLKSLVGDDMGTVREFLSDFLHAARSQAAEIIESCEAEDNRRVGAVAHKLKASSRSVGALALGDLCAELGNASRTGSRAQIVERRERFELAMNAVDACIVETLAESPN